MKIFFALACALAGLGLIWVYASGDDRPGEALENPARASPGSETRPPEPPQRVILITLDGVRWQDMFGGPDPELAENLLAQPTLPYFRQKMQPEGSAIGDRTHASKMRIGNLIAASLPGYHSLLNGRFVFCFTNHCGPSIHETLPERVQRELGLPPEQVAVIATYAKLCEAAQSRGKEGSITARCGEMRDGVLEDRHTDRETFDLALTHFKQHRPRFLLIGFDETDRLGHSMDYAGYLNQLREYDTWFMELDAVLESMGAVSRNTSILVTTDHGRGERAQFRNHDNPFYGGQTWLYARGPRIKRGGTVKTSTTYTSRDIRPTIEFMLGMEPSHSLTGGNVIWDIIQR